MKHMQGERSAVCPQRHISDERRSKCPEMRLPEGVGRFLAATLEYFSNVALRLRCEKYSFVSHKNRLSQNFITCMKVSICLFS